MINVFKLFNLKGIKNTEKFSDSEIKKLNNLSNKLKLKFNSPLLFAKALTHRSYLEKRTSLSKSNERLEFLGDAVLGLIVADILFINFRSEDEGFLTKSRSHIVDRNALYEAAKRLDLKQYLFYESRFIRDSEEGLISILADCMEALIGAIYLDQGLSKAKQFIVKWIVDPNLKSGKFQIDNNYKGQLLEFTHAHKFSSPEYILVDAEGPDHKKEFMVDVQIDEISYGSGKGRNKKRAEQEAAKQALIKLQK